MFIILGMVAALGLGIYVGLGAPGLKGLRQDRVVEHGRAKRLPKNQLDWLKGGRRY